MDHITKPAVKYRCQKCGEDIPESEVQTDCFDQLVHQADVDCWGDPPQFKPLMCGPVEDVSTPNAGGGGEWRGPEVTP